MDVNRLFPTYLKNLLFQMLISLLMLTITRILFFSLNSHYFSNISILDFASGIWLDCIVIGIWFIPLYGFTMLPNPYRNHKVFEISTSIIFHLTNASLIGLNLLDVEYFKFTLKRSTADLFTLIGTGSDFTQLFWTFVIDFWYLILIFTILIFLSYYLEKLILKKTFKESFSIKVQLIHFVLWVPSFFIIGRGGLNHRPADELTATKLTSLENTSLVLNTPLTIIKSIGKPALEEKFFFNPEDEHIFDPIQFPNNINLDLSGSNVMVIILESFGNEWLGLKSETKFSPFLDSLSTVSLYFSNGFANGKKSIEAMPAIFAGIPSLMDEPYITSSYGTNNIKGLPALLAEKGYSSAFFHGATNGSMKFDEFSKILGFQSYIGRSEYNNEDHSDHKWGILDEYFLPWTAQKMTSVLKEPFVAGLFTLSSHHPYYIPDKYQKVLPNGPEKICKSIAYADYSLRLFFQEAKKQPWYENTIFVLCADHSPAGFDAQYTQRTKMYGIPIIIFDPQNRIKPKSEKQIFSQIDISPTILDLLKYDKDFYAFGQSYYSPKMKFSISYLEGTYNFFGQNYLLSFSNDKPLELINYHLDPYLISDSSLQYSNIYRNYQQILKGFIQKYNQDLINNKTIIP